IVGRDGRVGGEDPGASTALRRGERGGRLRIRQRACARQGPQGIPRDSEPARAEADADLCPASSGARPHAWRARSEVSRQALTGASEWRLLPGGGLGHLGAPAWIGYLELDASAA